MREPKIGVEEAKAADGDEGVPDERVGREVVLLSIHLSCRKVYKELNSVFVEVN
jgi:hypothetical protein